LAGFVGQPMARDALLTGPAKGWQAAYPKLFCWGLFWLKHGDEPLGCCDSTQCHKITL